MQFAVHDAPHLWPYFVAKSSLGSSIRKYIFEFSPGGVSLCKVVENITFDNVSFLDSAESLTDTDTPVDASWERFIRAFIQHPPC